MQLTIIFFICTVCVIQTTLPFEPVYRPALGLCQVNSNLMRLVITHLLPAALCEVSFRSVAQAVQELPDKV